MLLLALLVLATGCGAPIRSDELARRVDTIASLASEGKLLGEDRGRDRSPRRFVRAHARELADDADDEAETLADATAERSLVATKAKAVRLAQDVSSAPRVAGHGDGRGRRASHRGAAEPVRDGRR